MATILRNPGPIYSVRYDKVPLAEVANSERTFPGQVDRPERLRRDRRVRALRQAAGRRRHGQPADGRRPAAHDPLSSRSTPTQKLPEYVPQADRQRRSSSQRQDRRRCDLDRHFRYSSDTHGSMYEITPQARFPGRHRFRRLRVRHDGAEAQGVLHSEHHQPLRACRA